MSVAVTKRTEEQFINGISDDEMMTEIIRQFAVIKEIEKSQVSKYYAVQKG